MVRKKARRLLCIVNSWVKSKVVNLIEVVQMSFIYVLVLQTRLFPFKIRFDMSYESYSCFLDHPNSRCRFK